MHENLTVSELIGKTLASVENINDVEIVFTTIDGERYRLLHYQDCCENVTVEDVIGDLSDLVGAPILMAEEATNDREHPEGVEPDFCDDSFIWTFYKFATIKGYVTIRWFGTSNGYYSESVDFERCGEAS